MTGGGKPTVVLTGPMGSGKTSVGRAIAAITGVGFRDTDVDIETSQGRPIAEIFTGEGEPHFREIERAAVLVALREHDGVLALGGGAILSDVVRDALTDHTVVFLYVSMPVGVARTGLANNRPLLAGLNPRATYKRLLEARLPLYRERAVLEVDTDDVAIEEVAQLIVDKLGLGVAGPEQ